MRGLYWSIAVGWSTAFKSEGTTEVKYRKRPLEVEAVQFLGRVSWSEIVRFLYAESQPNSKQSITMKVGPNFEQLSVVNVASGAEQFLKCGDWLIRGIEGEYYPCTNSVFEKTYEFAD
jgi:hypothetical protein